MYTQLYYVIYKYIYIEHKTCRHARMPVCQEYTTAARELVVKHEATKDREQPETLALPFLEPDLKALVQKASEEVKQFRVKAKAAQTEPAEPAPKRRQRAKTPQ